MRKLLCLFMALVMCVALVGCASEADESTGDIQDNSANPEDSQESSPWKELPDKEPVSASDTNPYEADGSLDPADESGSTPDESEADGILSDVIGSFGLRSDTPILYSYEYDSGSNQVTLIMLLPGTKDELQPVDLNGFCADAELVSGKIVEAFKDAGLLTPEIYFNGYDTDNQQVIASKYVAEGYFNYSMAIAVLDYALSTFENDKNNVLAGYDFSFTYLYDFTQDTNTVDLFLESDISQEDADENMLSSLKNYGDSCADYTVESFGVYGLEEPIVCVYIYDNTGNILISYQYVSES